MTTNMINPPENRDYISLNRKVLKMKANIEVNHELILIPESSIEFYALMKWCEANKLYDSKLPMKILAYVPEEEGAQK